MLSCFCLLSPTIRLPHPEFQSPPSLSSLHLLCCNRPECRCSSLISLYSVVAEVSLQHRLVATSTIHIHPLGSTCSSAQSSIISPLSTDASLSSTPRALFHHTDNFLELSLCRAALLFVVFCFCNASSSPNPGSARTPAHTFFLSVFTRWAWSTSYRGTFLSTATLCQLIGMRSSLSILHAVADFNTIPM